MQGKLTETELKVIELFVNSTRALGLPKSVGEIYGLVFASVEPLDMEAIMEKLGLSLGSTSQGLKTLRSLGAVRTTYTPGVRKDFYVAELDFRKIITQYLSDVLLPQFAESRDKLEQLNQLLADDDTQSDSVIEDRVEVLLKVSKRVNLILPAVSKILSV